MLRDARQRVLLPLMKQLTIELRAQAHRSRTSRCSRARTANPRRRPRSARRSRTSCIGCSARRELFARRRDPRQVQRRGRQLTTRTSLRIRTRTGSAITDRFLASLGVAPTRYTTQIEPHDWIAEYCQALVATQHRAHRLVPRLLGLHQLGVLPLAAGRRRGRLVDDAAQGEPDRLRERRGQFRARERGAAASWPTSCRSRAGSATSRTPRCCATSASRSATRSSRSTRGSKGLGKLEADPAPIAADLETLGSARPRPSRRSCGATACRKPTSSSRSSRAAAESTAKRCAISFRRSPIPAAERAAAAGARALDYYRPRGASSHADV